MSHSPDKAVLAAITSAVSSYIRTQQAPLAVETAVAAACPVPTVTASFYAASGRQQMMEMRRLLSMRLNRR